MKTLTIDMNSIKNKLGKTILRNLPVADLVAKSIENKEGILADTGALCVYTGKYSGRSPKDRFIVKQESIANEINWGESNIPISEHIFDKLYRDLCDYLLKKELYVFDGYCGTMKEYRLPIRVVCEYAYQALASYQLFVRPTEEELKFHNPEFTIISAPGFKCKGKKDGVNSEAFIIINFDKKIIIIGGTKYVGEIKKGMFSIMNFIMPQINVFPMHCSANICENGNTTIFFGLSGTGKTTLSADPEKKLIGDDEHGWSKKGIFNFEGGCYAKTINLDKDKEKEIYEALRFGAVLENVVLDINKSPNYYDDRYTENTRGAYPIDYIPNAELSGIGNIPETIIFLTADAFGVLPPISKLTTKAAMYHFMSGYTSKLAGTERGITKPQATFSACFGEPFMLRSPYIYAKLLGEKLEKHQTEVYLINTGWCGGEYGIGKRIDLNYTRAMVKAATEGKLKESEYILHPIFKLLIPKEVPGVPSTLLNPINTWENKEKYWKKANELAEKFNKNFKRYNDVPQNIIDAGPLLYPKS